MKRPLVITLSALLVISMLLIYHYSGNEQQEEIVSFHIGDENSISEGGLSIQLNPAPDNALLLAKELNRIYPIDQDANRKNMTPLVMHILHRQRDDEYYPPFLFCKNRNGEIICYFRLNPDDNLSLSYHMATGSLITDIINRIRDKTIETEHRPFSLQPFLTQDDKNNILQFIADEKEALLSPKPDNHP